ncbi:MAG: protein TolQ [Pseudomonadales bacterium]|nr:protein TolQ [Gammaproteobacteria bacterium]
MSEQLSLWELVVNATVVVQLVMLMLAAASLASWLIIFQRWIQLARIQGSIDAFEEFFWSGTDLRSIYAEVESRREAGLTGIETVFVAGFKEYQRLTAQGGTDGDAVMQGVQRAMRVALAREEENLSRHLSFLATVGSTSPYVGLFGTVWGIMHSFRNLASVSQATLATVAPGISEALIATAMGLFAAIPAVIGYNRFASKVDALMNRYDTFADEFSSILHRATHGQRSRTPTKTSTNPAG